MAEQTQAAPSPATAFESGNVTLAEFTKFRQDGEIPQRFQPAEPAEPAPADAPEQTEDPEVEETEPAPDSDPEDSQEQPKKGSAAEKRIKQLLAERNEWKRKAEAAQQGVKTDSPPAQPKAPGNFQEWFKAFDPAKWVNDYIVANPETSYERANAEMAVYIGDARDAFRERDQQARASAEKVAETVEEARSRYGEDFDNVIEPTAGAILSDPAIPVDVKRMIAESDVAPELVFTLGEDEATLKKFTEIARKNPFTAIRYLAMIEAGIRQEESGSAPERDANGQFKASEAPETRRTAAPKPPNPVGAGASRAFDPNDESLSPAEWARKRNEQLARHK